MTLVSPQQSNPGETIEASDINNPVNALATVINGNIDSTNISSVSGSKVQAGTLNASAMDTATNVETRLSESIGNFVASGLVWSASTGLSGTMTAGIAYVNGKRLSISSIASRTFTASKDTYVSADATGVVNYLEVANNAAIPSMPANSIWLAKVVTSASAVTSTINYSGVAMFTNTGTAGGTFFYRAVGGRKELWGISNVTTGNSNQYSLGINLPSGFFNSIQSIQATLGEIRATNNLYTQLGVVNTSSVTYHIINPSSFAGAGGAVNIYVLGS